ncbi:MAG: HEAT repeat domain-containing protein [Cyanobacteria bacterium P01_A01_bin.83]
MTYIKPEAASNQTSLIKDILEQGTEAAQRCNWLEVSHQLSLLPRTGKKTKLFNLNTLDWHTAFDLALKMLIEADFQHKWDITKLLPLFGLGVIDPLSNLVLEETVAAEVRWFSCQVLGNFPQQKVILTLVTLLQQTADGELIEIAGKTLIKVGDRAVAALVDLLEQPEHRLLAVKSLSYIRTTQTITPLLSIATQSDPELCTIAIKALGSFHDPRVAPVLIEALENKASAVRKEAAIALGFRPDLCQELNLVTRLQPLLFDLDLEVCSQTAIALSRMKQPEATKALYEVLRASTTPMMLKLEIVKALGWSEISSGIDYLRQALYQANEAITQEIIVVLGRISAAQLKPQCAQVLIDFWQQQQRPSPQTKQVLATSLGELKDKSAQPVLEQLAADGDRKVKLHAQAALKKLG